MIDYLILLLSGIQIGIETAFISGFIFLFKIIAWLSGFVMSCWFVILCCCVMYGTVVMMKYIFNRMVSKFKKIRK